MRQFVVTRPGTLTEYRLAVAEAHYTYPAEIDVVAHEIPREDDELALRRSQDTALLEDVTFKIIIEGSFPDETEPHVTGRVNEPETGIPKGVWLGVTEAGTVTLRVGP